MNLNNKNFRKKLIDRYLQAETTVMEENLLAEYFTVNNPDEDEAAAARLILSCAGEGLLSGEGTREFDRIVKKRKSAKAKVFARWAIPAAAAAAALALLLFLRPFGGEKEAPISPVAIAESIESLMTLDPDGIESIVATPQGSKAILTAHLKDGSAHSYILSCDGADGSLLLVAVNNDKEEAQEQQTKTE